MILAETTLPAAENSAANSSALVLNDKFPTKTFVCITIYIQKETKRRFFKKKNARSEEQK
jgi:hypothetical protein